MCIYETELKFNINFTLITFDVQAVTFYCFNFFLLKHDNTKLYQLKYYKLSLRVNINYPGLTLTPTSFESMKSNQLMYQFQKHVTPKLYNQRGVCGTSYCYHQFDMSLLL